MIIASWETNLTLRDSNYVFQLDAKLVGRRLFTEPNPHAILNPSEPVSAQFHAAIPSRDDDDLTDHLFPPQHPQDAPGLCPFGR